MCLIILALEVDTNYPVVMAANRDEFFNRPAAPMHKWGHDNIIAGKDLKGGGTWLGISSVGNIAAITNYRDPNLIVEDAPSRGALPIDYLTGNQSATNYLDAINQNSDQYNGFNLLLSDKTSFYHFSNVTHKKTKLEPGIHGLSNHLLNTSWPKVEKGKRKMEDLIRAKQLDEASIFSAMYDKTTAGYNELPDTGISKDLEKKISPMFIRTKGYGTRCTTIIKIDKNHKGYVMERTFDENDSVVSELSFQFDVQ